jgi:DNA-binding XRE family transcriptional regulator
MSKPVICTTFHVDVMGPKDAPVRRIRFVEHLLHNCIRTLDTYLRSKGCSLNLHIVPENDMKRGLKHNKKFEKEFVIWKKNFGIVVKQLRMKRRLSRPELAKKAKLSVSTLQRIEQGRSNPGITRMSDLAVALKHTLSYLFKRTQELNDKEGL